MKSGLTALAFSILYIGLYSILRGDGVIYHYPRWSPPAAATYVTFGILLQGWFCFGRTTRAPGPMLVAQVVTGILYVLAIAAFPGGIYQS